MVSWNWRLRPYIVDNTLFDTPRETASKTSQNTFLLEKNASSALDIAYHRTPKPWSRYPASLPIPGYEPMAFVYQSSLPTIAQYFLVLGIFSQAAFFIVRHARINLFPKILPMTMLTNRNWPFFAHRGT